MKNYLSGICLILLSIGLSAQTKNNKLGLTIGGGFQNYKGDLGSAFKFKNTTSYGAIGVNLGYYMNKSFDIGLFGTIGDYGFCQDIKIANTEIADEDRCGGCNRVGLGNLNSRLTSGGILLKYKLNNGYLLKEDARLKPYIYFGTAYNNISDIMKMNCINPGNYFSINSGLGLKYYINERINVGYNLSLGYFTSDNLDFRSHHSNDMYMQNTLTLGIDLF